MMFGGLFKGRKVEKAKKVSYEESKEYAASESHAERKALAKRTDVKPEVLYFLAEDKSPTVRRKVATNPSTPRQADMILATDSVDEVRCDLALKIGRLVPNISETESARLQEVTFKVLETLASDALPRVRKIVADQIKHADNVPKNIIDQLARDVELIVAAPILEYSPLLTDEDLLEIISDGTAQGGLNAIARRSSVNPDVSDAIVAARDIPAVAVLLANKNAQIREETLDQIVEGAADQEPLHEPLVTRPEMSQNSLRRISSFVSLSLLDILSEKHNLDDETEKVVRQKVKEGLKTKDVTKGETKAQDEAQKLIDNDELNDESAMKMVKGRKHDVLVRAMAIKAEVPVSIGKKIIESKSGKTVTALVWKAGLSMRSALEIQREVAKVPPNEIVNARDGVEYSLTEDEMSWYLDFFAE
jgi:uncharacterized protein (DUF2336 family)